MTDLLGAADVSGNPIEGNYKYMGLVIGTKENLNSISKCLELNQFSSKLRIKDKGVRKSLASKLEFNCRENIAFCVKIDKDRIISNIISHVDKKRLRIPHDKIHSIHNKILLRKLHEKTLKFLRIHNYELHKVIFECDSDCRTFARDNGLKYTDPGYAHIISDIIAWANNNELEPKGVIVMDLSHEIESELRKALLK